ncbi:MAG: shikimate dehydrogenase family protein [Thomasclavelia ramosa]
MQQQVYMLLSLVLHHSKSPAMHNTAFEQLGLDSVYLAFDIKSEELKDTIAGFKAMKVRGANVSMPHKQNIIPYLDEISTASRLCNAVNTITLKDGKYYVTLPMELALLEVLKSKDG